MVQVSAVQMYLTMNPEERQLYYAEVSAQNHLEILEHEFDVYQHDMHLQIEELQLEISNSKKKATLLFKCLMFMVVLYVVFMMF